MTIVFIGTGEIGVPALKALAESPNCGVIATVTQPDRPAGRSQELRPSPIKEVALSYHLKIFQPDDINTQASVEQLRYLKPDLIVVAAYGQVLSPDVLSVPKIGCLNIHASLLPKYRGASPIQAAILGGERETGITIIWMDEGLDTGDILLQEKTPIRSKDTAGMLHNRLADLGAKAILKSLNAISKGNPPKAPQDDSLSSYARKMKKADGWIDWSLEDTELDRHIRAMQPWPGAFTAIPSDEDSKKLKIFNALVSHSVSGKPGEIVHIDKLGILVAAGKGGLLLREVQLEGKLRMAAHDFAKGSQLASGAILGSPPSAP